MELWEFQMVKVIANYVLENNVTNALNLCLLAKLTIKMHVDTLVKLMVLGKKVFIQEFIEILI